MVCINYIRPKQYRNYNATPSNLEGGMYLA
jgi:hypothetical protein